MREAGERARASRRSSAQQLLPFGRGRREIHAARSPTRRATTRLPAAPRRRSRRCSPPGCRCACVALSAPGGYDTHDNQAAGRSRTASKLDRPTSLLAFQRDLEARGLADRVLVHVWSEFGRRGEENGSDGTDHGAAGLGLPDRLARRAGQMIGEFPGLAAARRGRQPARDRPTSAASTARCSSSGSAHDAGAVIPEAGALRAARRW